jgi:hypothetical protein
MELETAIRGTRGRELPDLSTKTLVPAPIGALGGAREAVCLLGYGRR